MRLSSAAVRRAPAALPREAPRVAVVVDARAPGATDRALRLLSHVVEAEDLYLARSREEMAHVARRVLEREYDTVFLGGGDVTFSRFTTALLRGPRAHPSRLPRLGLLPLGGAQRLATLVGASGLTGEGLLDDVLRARAEEVPGARRMDLLEVEGQLAPFAGAGLEAQLLHERAWLQKRLGHTPLRRLLEGAGTLAPAVALHSLSSQLARTPEVECEVRCGAGGALLLGEDGGVAGTLLAPGTVLFRGRARRADATSLPSGCGSPTLARGRMHLRVDASAGILPELARLLRREERAGTGHTFLASEVRLSFAQAVPVQVGGGVAGARDALHLRVVPEAVELCDFSGGVH